jgi:Tfp pilus assembly protein PilF
MGREEEAEEQYKLALKANSNHPIAHLNYGNFLSELGREEEAEEQYKFALEAAVHWGDS